MKPPINADERRKEKKQFGRVERRRLGVV